MVSSKVLALTLTSSFLRSSRLAGSSLLPVPFRRLQGAPLRSCSAAVDVADDPAAAAGHPWPEWGDFLEKLRAKGYFKQPTPASRVDAAEGAAGEREATAAEDAVASADSYPCRDLDRVKNACLKFGRARFDLLGSLPKQDIQAIVECGCPNIFRKPVSSAKRLREFVQVDEGDACSACKLRGSCDKAYIIPKDEEVAHTVDVMRILLSYAIDPTSLSGENSVNGGVQKSARKLLLELTVLSDTTIDSSLPKPVLQTSSKLESVTKKSDKGTQSVVKSRVSAGKGRETTVTEMKKGEWLCPNCNFLNFGRNWHCLECKADGPKKIEATIPEMKTGDWICPQCHFMNFSRNKMCFKCEESRPKRHSKPGEWECPSCCFVNFQRNKVCLKCNHEGPEGQNQDNQLGYNRWRNTKGADRRSFDSVGLKDDVSNQNKGESKHVVSKRATPAQRRFTASGGQ
ncbi:hypothetical protein GUJ93_ZPchr0013g34480 [Zizania palustris]|uniref:RanBP2-type domain-containing protein n=1 Tax=Zizania palustris TaxID=103762 RepID=A0A8J5WY64_ZIZPA|nr:hypothetical protein GUJ93_ZPchr0013g34480 [Zizania palustris]